VNALGRIVLAGAIWSAVWLILDLTWGGLIHADFNTAGLQQACSLLLYFVGWVVILVLGVALVLGGHLARRHHVANRS
jgi:hypothetical protein